MEMLEQRKNTSMPPARHLDLVYLTPLLLLLLLLSHLSLCDPIDGSPPGFLSLGFSRQEHWSGLPFPSPMHESEK